jgi:hypothetical protein
VFEKTGESKVRAAVWEPISPFTVTKTDVLVPPSRTKQATLVALDQAVVAQIVVSRLIDRLKGTPPKFNPFTVIDDTDD